MNEETLILNEMFLRAEKITDPNISDILVYLLDKISELNNTVEALQDNQSFLDSDYED